MAQLVRAQIDAEEAARRGGYAEARQVMTLFQSAVASRGHERVASAAGKIADRVGDAAAFDGSSGYRSSMRKGGSRSVVTLYQAEAHDDLESMGLGKTTLAQDQMVDSFGARKPRRGSPSRSSGEAAPAGRGLARKRSRRW